MPIFEADTFGIDRLATGRTLHPRRVFGLGEAGDMRFAWHPTEGLYAITKEDGVGTAKLWSSGDILQDEWTEEGSVSVDTTPGMQYPLVADDGSLIIGISGDTYRSTDWENFSEVITGAAPLYLSRHSSIDRTGDIYVGGYQGTAEVYKSTDNGATWTALNVNTPTNADHIHAVAVSPHQDIMLIIWGDTLTNSLDVARKDYSANTFIEGLPSGMPSTAQWVPGHVLPRERGDSNDQMEVLLGADTQNFSISRQEISLDGTDTVSRTHQYTYAPAVAEPNIEYVPDIKNIAGRIFAITRNGNLLYSDDSWMWRAVQTPLLRENGFNAQLVEGNRHVFLASHRFVVIPKDALFALPSPTRSHYWGPDSGTSSRVKFVNDYPGSIVDEVRAYGFDNTNTPSIELGQGSATTKTVVADINSGGVGTAQNEFPSRGIYVDVGVLSSGSLARCQVIKKH